MKFKKIGEYTVILVISFLILFGFEAPNILLIFFPPLFFFRHWRSFSPAAGELCSEPAAVAHDVIEATEGDKEMAQMKPSPALKDLQIKFSEKLHVSEFKNKG